MKTLPVLVALPLLAACSTVPPATPEFPLTSWRFVAIDGKAPLSDQTELKIFDGRLAASVGCNRMSASLELVPGQMKVGTVSSTRMYCASLMDQERAVAELLGESPAFFIEGNRFGMRSQNHSAELVKVIER